MLGLPRVFLAMARDGLLPEKFFMEIHPVYRTPWKSTILNGICVGAGAGARRARHPLQAEAGGVTRGWGGAQGCCRWTCWRS